MAKLNAKGRTLTDLIANLEQPNESKEFRFTVLEEDFGKYGMQVITELEKKVLQHAGWEVVKPNYERIRVRCASEKGWFLLRLSLHDPVMPLNIESGIEGGVSKIAAELKKLLTEFNGLKIDALDE